jgi:hypothetical protein
MYPDGFRIINGGDGREFPRYPPRSSPAKAGDPVRRGFSVRHGAAGILGHPPTRVMTAWTLIHLPGVCAAAGGASDRPKAAAAKNGKETSDPLHGVLPNSCFRPMGSFNGRHWARRIRLSETRTGVSGKDLPGLSRGINQPGRGYRAAAHASMNANHSFLAVIDLTPSSVVLRIDPPIIPPTMTGIQ